MTAAGRGAHLPFRDHPAMENVTQLLVAMQALSADVRTVSKEMQARVPSAP